MIERLSSDKAFRVKYCQDPDGTLSAYHLTPDEILAFKSGDDHLAGLTSDQKWEDYIQALCGPNPGD